MALFITSTSSVTRHDVFAIERTPPASIVAQGTGVACIVGQFPWGPSQTLTAPSSVGDALLTFAPPGMDRTGNGYLSMIRKAWPDLKVVRVLGSTAATATCTLVSVTPTNILTLTAKYPGTAGNSLVATVTDASDGDANHFNLSVTVTGASGTTTDTLQNLNYSGTGADSTPDFTKCRLIGGITKLVSGIVTRVSTNFGSATSGTNGTITGATYVGTAGSGNLGMALMEGDPTIRHFFHDCTVTGSDLATANAGGVAHANLMTDRMFYMNGPSAETASAAQTYVASYRSANVAMVDPWCYVLDDTDGTKRLVPSAPFAASVAAQISPSTSIAWKSPEVQKMLSGVNDLEAQRGAGAGVNTSAGIITLIQGKYGGFVFEAGKTTITPSDPTKQNITRTNMGIYMASSIVNSIYSLVDGPNVPANQQDIVNAVDTFLSGLKRNSKTDPNHLPYILDYAIPDLGTVNTPSSLANGDFFVPVDVQIGASMERIFLSIRFGETVQVVAS